jgi:hypothetical protein
MAYPGALIYLLGNDKMRRIALEETEHDRLTRDFLMAPERYFKHLFSSDESEESDESDESEDEQGPR